jgi:hypothetical protein
MLEVLTEPLYSAAFQAAMTVLAGPLAARPALCCLVQSASGVGTGVFLFFLAQSFTTGKEKRLPISSFLFFMPPFPEAADGGPAHVPFAPETPQGKKEKERGATWHRPPSRRTAGLGKKEKHHGCGRSTGVSPWAPADIQQSSLAHHVTQPSCWIGGSVRAFWRTDDEHDLQPYSAA